MTSSDNGKNDQETSLSIVKNDSNENHQLNETPLDNGEDKSEMNEDLVDLSFPKFTLHRNSDLSQVANEFIPSDLITLLVKGTGDWKSSRAVMLDSRDQIRYQAISGGKDHNWTTRIQRTKTFGDWKYVIEGPLDEENKEFNQELSFSIVQYLPEQVIIDEEPIVAAAEFEKIEIPVIEISGVGPTYATRLNDAGIFYFYQMKSISPLNAAEITNGTPTKAEGWFEFIDAVFGNPNHELMRKYHPIDSKEFIPLVKENDDTTQIKGIGPATSKKLVEAGYQTIKSMADSKPKNLADKLNTTQKKVLVWISDAQMKLYGKSSVDQEKVEKVKPKIETVKPDDPATKIKGIGPSTYKKLENANFKSVKDIADALPEEVAKAIKVSISKVTNWVSNAQILIFGASEIDVSKVKKVKEVAEKEPLMRIRGVGPTYNKRFKENGIENLEKFSQLSVEKIAELGKVNVSKAKQWLNDSIKLSETK